MTSRIALAVCTAFALAVVQPLPIAGAATPPGDAAQIEIASWPHTITGAGGAATIYAPQAISWSDLKTLTARAAVSILPEGQQTPFYGVIEMSVSTDADLDTRSVILTHPKLIKSSFPSLDAAQAEKLDARIREAMAALPPKRLPLDTVLLSLKEQPTIGETAPIRNDAPKIFVSDRPASLVVFDGEPVLSPIAGSTLSFAVNTNWDVFKDGDGAWYMLNGATWLTAPAFSGPWVATTNLPAAFSTLPDDANFASVRKMIPAQAHPGAAVPTIFVSTAPAEIIVAAGPPKLAPVAGTSLQYVSNTASNLIFDPAGKRYYYLVSGRWFSAESLDGPWTFATPDLPADFARIPADGPRGGVLVSVPGTPQAKEAVIQAEIPRQATLKRSAALTVTYGGPPHFVPIPGTSVQYAVNTHYDVLLIRGVYYAVYQGAWFKSASPTGPWVLADSVPPEVAKIPPSSPMYPVTYVQVYAASPEAVTFGYTAGYVMGFISAGVVAYGTGYYYPPVIVPGPIPAYYPYPYSYAGGAYYATGGAYYGAGGGWARGGSVYGPYGGAGAWSAYNPNTGSYAHGSAVWGPYGGTANASWYNARSGVSGYTNQNSNAYGRWGSSTFAGPNATVNTQSGSNARGSAGSFSSSTGAAGAGVHGANGNRAGVARGANGDVYAGADGNVYRHDSSGWSKYDNGSWNPVQKPASQPTRSTFTQATNTAANTQARSGARNNAATTTPARSSSSGRSASGAPSSGSGQSAHVTNARATTSSSYGQLEQDRQARSFGANQTAGGQQGRFGGGGFGGNRSFGGGRRR